MSKFLLSCTLMLFTAVNVFADEAPAPAATSTNAAVAPEVKLEAQQAQCEQPAQPAQLSCSKCKRKGATVLANGDDVVPPVQTEETEVEGEEGNDIQKTIAGCGCKKGKKDVLLADAEETVPPVVEEEEATTEEKQIFAGCCKDKGFLAAEEGEEEEVELNPAEGNPAEAKA